MGFSVDSLALLPRPTPLPGDVSEWLETFAQSYTAALPANQTRDYIFEVVEALQPDLCEGNGNYHADYVRLRFPASKP
jgi:hypothetical protein